MSREARLAANPDGSLDVFAGGLGTWTPLEPVELSAGADPAAEIDADLAEMCAACRPGAEGAHICETLPDPERIELAEPPPTTDMEVLTMSNYLTDGERAALHHSWDVIAASSNIAWTSYEEIVAREADRLERIHGAAEVVYAGGR